MERPTYYHTIAFSAEQNSLYVTTGTATKNVITSVGAGTATHSIENADISDGSAECDKGAGIWIWRLGVDTVQRWHDPGLDHDDRLPPRS